MNTVRSYYLPFSPLKFICFCSQLLITKLNHVLRPRPEGTTTLNCAARTEKHNFVSFPFGVRSVIKNRQSFVMASCMTIHYAIIYSNCAQFIADGAAVSKATAAIRSSTLRWRWTLWWPCAIITKMMWSSLSVIFESREALLLAQLHFPCRM